jgi:(1->4)-alpha-D-glucan 1-alpha-D-glucosylmutase
MAHQNRSNPCMSDHVSLSEERPDSLDRQRVDDIITAVTQRMEKTRLPTATYRVQLNVHCTFREVTQIVPYLHALGISDLYVSPFLQARPGSVHGYDIVNHAVINPEIGTLDELRALRAALRDHGMGLIADVVPNHMAAAPQLNAWWQDVLENGPSSAYASYFDIDWMPLKHDLAHKVLLPVLGDQFGTVLENSQLVVVCGHGAFWLTYFEERFPISPCSYTLILSLRLEELQQQLGNEHADVLELFSILTAIKNLPTRNETETERVAERRREKEIVKRRLYELMSRSPEIAEFIAENVRQINGQVGEPHSFDRLDELLLQQAYRLAYWRVAADEINYRRFFDVNELAALCTESPPVFMQTHQFLFDLLDEGIITGLRIDHPDGLYDPWQYLCQLQQSHFLRLCHEEAHRLGVESPADERFAELWRAASLIPGSPLARPLYLVVEKILAPDETLPENWPVHGTVGYEFLNPLNGLFVDSTGARPLSVLYEQFTRQSLDFAELAYQCKRLIVRTSMAGELNVLGDRLDRISESNRLTRDFTLRSLTRALQEVMACFSVYRTYVQFDQVLERDALFIERAVDCAKRRNPATSGMIFDFIRDVLSLRGREKLSDEQRQAYYRFACKFQQLSGPIMAKAVEDTAFYRFNRLVSLNEVGGEPEEFGTSVDQFHRFNQSRLPRLSHSMNATSTHDTKRSEDVRARINVLSEIPREWRQKVQSWSRLHRRLKEEVDGSEAPSRNTQYLLYQTLVGLWPDVIPVGAELETFVARIQQYLLKVEREAKVHTSWISPHEAYEATLCRFVAEILTSARSQSFLHDLHEFAGKVATHGCWNSLSQLVLKITSPGVPDFYQGTEFWSCTLVDPDNRQPVDWQTRQQVFRELATEVGDFLGAPLEDGCDAWFAYAHESNQRPLAEFLQRLLQHQSDGRLKLFVTWLALNARQRHSELFPSGDYIPLQTTGALRDSVIAFARRHGDQIMIAIVPRLTVNVVGFNGTSPIGDVWRDTAVILSDSIWNESIRPESMVFHEIFSRQSWTPSLTDSTEFPLTDALHDFPVGIWLLSQAAPT